MATHSVQTVEPLLWRARLTTGDSSLAEAIREKIAATRAHLLDFIKLDEPHPHHAMTLAQWQQPAKRQSLLATYSDHIYRNQPTLTRENKPLLSLWAQWY
ncbi:hydroxamate siderophore iron reductase FhuF, partial [Escherichia coli]